MPSVGSTPTTSSPAPQPQQTSAPALALAPMPSPAPMSASVPVQVPATVTATAPVANKRRHKHAKMSQQQQRQHQPQQLPLQLQYQHYQPQQMTPVVTTTQPTPAGVFTHNNNNHSYNSNNNINSNINSNNNNNNDMSPISNSNSYSSVDTNQTLLNSIANQRGGSNHQRQNHHHSQNHQSRKYSQFMIITPAVSIDRDFEYESHLDFEDFANAAHNNGNLFRLGLRRSGSSSDDSGHSSDSSFRSNYNPYLHHSRQHLLSNKSNNGCSSRRFYTFSSWRWCTLLCAAMRCFGAGHGNQAPYSSSFVQHHRLRRCSSYNGDTAYDYEHFAAPFKARKTRDHMNNITYEL